MRMLSKFVSVAMLAVMLFLSIGVAHAFADIGQNHNASHAGADCPCPDKTRCPDGTPCQDVSACIAGCLHFYAMDIISVVTRIADPQNYAHAHSIIAGGLTHPPPLPPPTV